MNFALEITDELALQELGRRLARTRLERNMDQAGLATEAGLSKSTIERLEAGQAVRTASLVRALRALGLLENLDLLVPEPVPSPLERLKTSGRQRRRASGRRGANGSGRPSDTWSWGDPAERSGVD